MPRKLIVRTADGQQPILVESLADDEAQLQELVKENPDLLPIEEFGLSGPIMVVGRETTLPCGAERLTTAIPREKDAFLRRTSRSAISWSCLFQREATVVSSGDECGEVRGQLLQEQHEIPA